jgi:alkanesulfonate monooxygenase SsuD/methylene tetrahydromethanopterin reductase-like flavin-dependent oxidoreductase (luciferase family)
VRALLSTGFDDREVSLAPRAPDVPFFLGGWKEAAMRRAAALGDGWIGYLLGPDSFARRRALLHECRDQLGRAEAPFTTGMLVPVHVDRSERARANAAAAWANLTKAQTTVPERLFAAGSPDDVIEQLFAYRELGCDEFMLAPADQGDGYLYQVDLLCQEVLPRIRELT